MAKVVNCPCGEKITGDTDDELVRLVQEHGKEVHQQEVSRDDALAMAHHPPSNPAKATVRIG